MSTSFRVLVVNHIKLPVNASFQEAFSLAEKRLRRVLPLSGDEVYTIYRRSVDARHKEHIQIEYSVAVQGNFSGLDVDALAAQNITGIHEELPAPRIGTRPMTAPPVVVGTGPCGLFAALLLAEAGYAPVVLERGGPVAQRRASVECFYREHILDPADNIQFGAGGAGTFSDGKLITRINDPFVAYVLRRFVEFGAPPEILYQAKPHIGTDILSAVVDKMLASVVSAGGRVLYHTRFIRSENRAGTAVAVQTDRGEIPAGALLLAIGHSARDTYGELLSEGYSIEPKSFSVGLRIEHPTERIDRAMYGKWAGHPALGHAEYALSHNTRVRGVYTFCMCPGGEVVAAASEEGGVVVNGMSNHARDGINSNSAVVCSVFREDYGNTPAAAVAFQRRIEQAAFRAAGGEYRAPVITAGDFLAGCCKTAPTSVLPTYMGGVHFRLVSPDEYLPPFVCTGIRDALLAFDRRLHGFASPDAVLTGPETRTSAPLRILRDPVTRTALGYENIYPAGEGAGYAGGITSAAVDGVRTATALMEKYAPCP